MAEKEDKTTRRILAIAALIGALSPVIIAALDLMGKGSKEVQVATAEEIREVQQKNEVESVPQAVKDVAPDPVVLLDSEPERVEAKNPVVFELIREGYVLKEERYLPFYNNLFRLFPKNIDPDNNRSNISITDNNGNELGSGLLLVGESLEIELDSKLFKIELIGTRSRALVSNLAYFNIYQAELSQSNL